MNMVQEMRALATQRKKEIQEDRGKFNKIIDKITEEINKDPYSNSIRVQPWEVDEPTRHILMEEGFNVTKTFANETVTIFW